MVPQINAKKFSLALGIIGVIIYTGCFLMMSILGEDSFIKLANLLFHGLDFSDILRLNISFIETLIGIVTSLIFWGAIGYLIAFIYNKLI